MEMKTARKRQLTCMNYKSIIEQPIISNDKHSVSLLCLLHHELKNVSFIGLLLFIQLLAVLYYKAVVLLIFASSFFTNINIKRIHINIIYYIDLFLYLCTYLLIDLHIYIYIYIYNTHLNLDTYLFIHAAGCLNRTVSKTQKIQGTEDINLVGSPELKSPSESRQLTIFRDIQQLRFHRLNCSVFFSRD